MQVYRSQVLDVKGRPVPGALVNVYRAGTQSLATVYTDHGENAKTQPIKAGKDGWYEFKAAPGGYNIVASKDNWTSQPIPIVLSLPQEGLYNVRDYGLVTGGVFDNKDALQALMDRMVTEGGGTVYFPAGHYYFSGTVLYYAVANGITFRGALAGRGAYLDFADGDWGLRCSWNDPGQRYSFENLNFTGRGVIHQNANADFRMSNVSFDGGGENGLLVSGSEYCESIEIRDCRFYEMDESFLRVTVNSLATAPQVLVDNVKLFRSADYHVGAGLSLGVGESGDSPDEGTMGVGNFIVNRLRVFGCKEHGIQVNGGASFVMTGSVISGCNVDDLTPEQSREQVAFRNIDSVSITSTRFENGGGIETVLSDDNVPSVGTLSLAKSVTIDTINTPSVRAALASVGSVVDLSAILGNVGRAEFFARGGTPLNYWPDPLFTHWLHLPDPSVANASLSKHTASYLTGAQCLKVEAVAGGSVDTNLTCVLDSDEVVNGIGWATELGFGAWVYVPEGQGGTAVVTVNLYSGAELVDQLASVVAAGNWSFVRLTRSQSNITLEFDKIEIVFSVREGSGTVVAGDYMLIDSVALCNFGMADSIQNDSDIGVLVPANMLGRSHGARWVQFYGAEPGSLSPLNYYSVGDIIYQSAPTSYIGFICTGAGAGGAATWGQFGAVV